MNSNHRGSFGEFAGRRRGLSTFDYKPDVRGHIARSKAVALDIARLCEKASHLSSQPLPRKPVGPVHHN